MARHVSESNADPSHVILESIEGDSRSRTAATALSRPVARCETAPNTIAYKSSANRHCPIAKAPAARMAPDARLTVPVPVTNHVVFTLHTRSPTIATRHAGSTIFCSRSSAETIADDRPPTPKLWLARMVSPQCCTLGSAMTHHPPLARIVPAGASRPTARWVSLSSWILPARPRASPRVGDCSGEKLVARPRGRLLSLPSATIHLADVSILRRLPAPLAQAEWVATQSAVRRRPERWLAYCRVYTIALPIANSRLVAFGEQCVTIMEGLPHRGRDRLPAACTPRHRQVSALPHPLLPKCLHRPSATTACSPKLVRPDNIVPRP